MFWPGAFRCYSGNRFVCRICWPPSILLPVISFNYFGYPLCRRYHFVISSVTAGMSAKPITTPHSVRLSGWVLNIGLRKGTKTVATSSKMETRTAPTSQGLENAPIWKSESRSERQVKARNNSHRESVTKAMVSAVCTSTPLQL